MQVFRKRRTPAVSDRIADGVVVPAPRRRDRGSTYVEMVIAITLMAIVVVPTMRAVITSIQASTSATSAAEVETALLNAVDRINRSPADRCSYHQYATAAVLTQGWEESTVTTDHAYLNTDLATPDWTVGPDPTVGPACPDTGHRDDLIQQVSITVTSPDGKVSRTIKVVKSNV